MLGREHARNKRIACLMITIIAVVAAFAIGFALRSNITLMNDLGIPVATKESVGRINQTSKLKTTYESLSERISEVEDILSEYSLDEVDLGDATSSMLTQLFDATNDPYAAYYTEQRYADYLLESAERGYGGIGVLFGDYNGRAYAIDVLEGSPAQAEGVSKGDFVRAIDGDSSSTWSSSEVIGALSREEGEDVVITWMRPISFDATTGEEFTTTLKCNPYTAENVTTYLREEVGYIQLKQFTANAATLVAEAIESLTLQGARAFVLDVRDNPGGYLTQSIDAASLFIPSGVIVGIETNAGVSTRTANGSASLPISTPMVVLANSYTSGVAEVLVAALKDNQRATVVGQRTMGKGSVQVTRELSFGGAIRYTAAYYLTPNGREIKDNGVSPDIEVSNNNGDEGDVQLQVAIVTARSMISR